MNPIGPILKRSPVMPIITLHSVAHAVPLARALFDGGIRTAEVTLRTPVALDAIRAIRAEVPELVLGAGTVLNARDLENAARAGAAFAISPGSTPSLIAAAKAGPIPFLLGVATASEIMVALEAGFDHLKLFPATQLGGPDAIAAFAGPFPTVRFCPTGGINLVSATRYLALTNVVCVGGSWITPAAALARSDWSEIERLAREATALKAP